MFEDHDLEKEFTGQVFLFRGKKLGVRLLQLLAAYSQCGLFFDFSIFGKDRGSPTYVFLKPKTEHVREHRIQQNILGSGTICIAY